MNRFAAVRLSACCLVLAACSATAAPTSSPASATSSVTASATTSAPATSPALTQVDSSLAAQDACAQIDQHQYEVCFAYLFNATLLARVPFYASRGSGAPGLYVAIKEQCIGRTFGEAVTCRMWSRYYGAARTQLIRQVAKWPGSASVEAPWIRIDSVQSNLTTGIATIHTHETWLVKSGGKVLFAETNQPHTITLAKVPGLAVHKWVVTSFQ